MRGWVALVWRVVVSVFVPLVFVWLVGLCLNCPPSRSLSPQELYPALSCGDAGGRAVGPLSGTWSLDWGQGDAVDGTWSHAWHPHSGIFGVGSTTQAQVVTDQDDDGYFNDGFSALSGDRPPTCLCWRSLCGGSCRGRGTRALRVAARGVPLRLRGAEVVALVQGEVLGLGFVRGGKGVPP